MPQVRSPPAATKTQCNQINKQILKKQTITDMRQACGAFEKRNQQEVPRKLGW